MSPQNHVTEIIPAYALGSLDPDEQALVEQHLLHCQECQAEVQRFRTIVDRLALAIPETAPPPTLKRRILAQAQSDTVSDASPAVSPKISQWERIRTAWQQLFNRPIWQPIALILILVLTISNVLLWQRSSQPAPVTTITLNGTEAAPDASGIIVIGKDGRYGTLIVEDLPSLNATEQYQLWLILDGERANGGVFSVDNDGYTALEIDAPQPLRSYPAFGITIEPAGGSPGPTGAKVLGSN